MSQCDDNRIIMFKMKKLPRLLDTFELDRSVLIIMDVVVMGLLKLVFVDDVETVVVSRVIVVLFVVGRCCPWFFGRS